MVKDKINVNHRKQDEAPHKDMVQLPYVHISAQQRNHPCKKLGKERVAHSCIHAKTCESLKEEYEESDKVDQACQGIMTYGINLFMCGLEDIHFDDIHDLLPLASFQRDKVIPCLLYTSPSPRD